MLTLTHRYRIYPDSALEQQLIEWMEICRGAFNYALREFIAVLTVDTQRIEMWQQVRISETEEYASLVPLDRGESKAPVQPH
jgi:hypothetical protein